jgi:Raf kinase inhibitor-like YbhB/YbcL family protein
MQRRRSSPRFAAIAAMLVIVTACGSGPNATGPASTDGGSTGATQPSTSPAPAGAGTPAGSTGASVTPASPSPTTTPGTTPTPGPFTLTSSAFADGEPIPSAQTCDGADRSPPLAWTGVPTGAGALALVVDDPDARDFVHWLVIDLPAGATGSLPGNLAAGASSPRQGRNDFGRVGWGGPCPPSGTHHYRFTLSALAAPLGLNGHPDGSAVRQALRDATIIGRASLTGTYHR